MQRVIIVLGSENTEDGVLGTIAVSRLSHCLKMYKDGDRVLCTGGWGTHFNTTKTAHAYYAQEFLIKNGVLKMDLLEPVLSAHTVDDAVKLKPIIEELQIENIILITSDFHMERVQLIFNEIIKDNRIKFVKALNDLNAEDFKRYNNHEQKTVKEIKANGLYY